jgi:hypothetical protein
MNYRRFLPVAIPLNRYVINSPMLLDFQNDADGGLTLYIQHDSPDKDKECIWSRRAGPSQCTCVSIGPSRQRSTARGNSRPCNGRSESEDTSFGRSSGNRSLMYLLELLSPLSRHRRASGRKEG